jgi:hypothetical protein
MICAAIHRLATLLTLFVWLPTPAAPVARRVDRRIGLLVPNGAAAHGPSASGVTATLSSANFGVDHRSGQRLNADELVKLGVDADEVSRHVRRLEEDDTQNRQQQQQRSRQAPWVGSGQSAAAFQHLLKTVPKNADQIRSEHHLLRRYYIRNNRSAACNDGSRAG